MPRTVYLHGRPSHPFHQALARSVGADFLPKDFLLPWQGRDTHRARRLLSSFLCSTAFPEQAAYDLFLTEGPIFVPRIMRALRRYAPHQRAVAIMANETPYFLSAGLYTRASAAALRSALFAYDALICVGHMHQRLLREALGRSARPLLLYIPSCVPEGRQARLSALRPDLSGAELLYIAHVPAPFRAFYKGLDLTVAAAALARERVPALRLQVVGACDDEAVDWARSMGGVPRPAAAAPGAGWLRFAGPTADIAPALSRASLYLHLSRGDAGPITVLEAMAAGVPALVSELTGLKEAVIQVDPRLVVPLSADVAAERIVWYLRLPAEEKLALSARCRQVAARYPESRSLREFQAAVATVLALGRPVQEGQDGVGSGAEPPPWNG